MFVILVVQIGEVISWFNQGATSGHFEEMPRGMVTENMKKQFGFKFEVKPVSHVASH